MSRLVAHGQIWNAAQFISAPVLAIHQYVDEIYIFDGAYRFLQESGQVDVPQSTDNTEQVVQSLKLDCPLTWVPCEDFYENEVAKKMFMLEYWKPGEWKYWLNDDEIPGGDIEQACKRVRGSKALIGYVRMWEPRLNRKTGGLLLKFLGWKPRFFGWQEGMHWKDRHWPAYNAEGVPIGKWPGIKLHEMVFIHLTSLRVKERLLPQLDWSLRDKLFDL